MKRLAVGVLAVLVLASIPLRRREPVRTPGRSSAVPVAAAFDAFPFAPGSTAGAEAGTAAERSLPDPEDLPPPVPIADDSWIHTDDSDGDGLTDEFEAAHGLDAHAVSSVGDGVADEYRIGSDGRSMGTIQAAERAGERCRHR